MVNINIKKQYRAYLKNKLLRNAVKETLNYNQIHDDIDLTVMIADDDAVKALNEEYRQINKPTDVLSFASGEVDPETGRKYLGDIIISFDRASAQAELASHPVNDEIQLLVVHGVLHLLGYDHGTNQEKELMWSIQDHILEDLGCNIKNISDE